MGIEGTTKAAIALKACRAAPAPILKSRPEANLLNILKVRLADLLQTSSAHRHPPIHPHCPRDMHKNPYTFSTDEKARHEQKSILFPHGEAPGRGKTREQHNAEECLALPPASNIGTCRAHTGPVVAWVSGTEVCGCTWWWLC